MKKAPRRPAAKTPRRGLTLKNEMSPDEVLHLEQISRRYEEAERAWLRMTAPPEGDDVWTKVEEHLLNHSAQDQDRRWKFFSK